MWNLCLLRLCLFLCLFDLFVLSAVCVYCLSLGLFGFLFCLNVVFGSVAVWLDCLGVDVVICWLYTLCALLLVG